MLEQIDSLQRESELILDHLRHAFLPPFGEGQDKADPPPWAEGGRPRLTVVRGIAPVHGKSGPRAPGTNARGNGRLSERKGGVITLPDSNSG
jgi:hypothetical protein